MRVAEGRDRGSGPVAGTRITDWPVRLRSRHRWHGFGAPGHTSAPPAGWTEGRAEWGEDGGDYRGGSPPPGSSLTALAKSPAFTMLIPSGSMWRAKAAFTSSAVSARISSSSSASYSMVRSK